MKYLCGMNNIKHIIIYVLLSYSTNVGAQTNFYSIGTSRNMEEVPSAETDDEAIDTAIVELPKIMKDVKLVSFPLDNLRFTSMFGIRRDPINGTTRMHSGVDLAARFENVRAMLPGMILKTGYSKSAGYYITISHGICVCSYLHLSRIFTEEGTHVSAGDIVGVTGTSGRSTGPHLHISCRWNDGKGRYFNPILLLEFVASKLEKFP